MITNETMTAAVFAAGIGWDQFHPGIVVSSLATPGYCDADNCLANIMVANRGGATATEMAAALALCVGDPTTEPPTARDESALRAIESVGQDFAAAMGAVGLSWRVTNVPISEPTDSTILVWDPVARAATEVLVMHDGATVSPREYYAAGDAAAATTDDLADALRDLVDGDASMFDAIMSA